MAKAAGSARQAAQQLKLPPEPGGGAQLGEFSSQWPCDQPPNESSALRGAPAGAPVALRYLAVEARLPTAQMGSWASLHCPAAQEEVDGLLVYEMPKARTTSVSGPSCLAVGRSVVVQPQLST